MIKQIVGGTLIVGALGMAGMVALMEKYLSGTISEEERKELNDAIEEYQKALKEWKDKIYELLLEKPVEGLENFEEALEEWKTKVKELEEPKIIDYYDPTRTYYRIYITAVTSGCYSKF